MPRSWRSSRSWCGAHPNQRTGQPLRRTAPKPPALRRRPRRQVRRVIPQLSLLLADDAGACNLWCRLDSRRRMASLRSPALRAPSSISQRPAFISDSTHAPHKFRSHADIAGTANHSCPAGCDPCGGRPQDARDHRCAGSMRCSTLRAQEMLLQDSTVSVRTSVPNPKFARCRISG